MTRSQKILLPTLLCAVLLVGLVWYYILLPIMSSVNNDGSVQGPILEFGGARFQTRILEGNEGHNRFGVWLHFEIPKDIQFTLNDEVLREMCRAVVSNFEALVPEGVKQTDLNHIGFNFVEGSEAVFPYDLAIGIQDTNCTGGMGVKYPLPPEARFFQYEVQELLDANVISVGFSAPELKYVNGTDGRYIRASFELSGEVPRDLSQVSSYYLCILALAQVPKDAGVLGLTIDPTKYKKLKIVIEDVSRFGLFSTSETLGTAELEVQDGRCVPITETN